jgi:2-polyprenyl-6-methoxyphenol hydroxylase-like FAD-dependent oxidoreductase
MDILTDILAANTGEKGTIFTDMYGRARVNMPLEGGVSLTNDTEILRGTFAKILFDRTQNTEWRFGDQIKAICESSDGVDVGFASGKKEKFDLVVIADGVGSRTRKMVFGDEITFKKLGICT